MIYAVTIEPLKAVYFLNEPPAGDLWDVQDGISLDIPANYDSWPVGSECPEQILCTSTSDPRHYKVFKNAKDVDRHEFQPTGKRFGGVYSRTSWERFVKNLPATLAVLKIPDQESLDVRSVPLDRSGKRTERGADRCAGCGSSGRCLPEEGQSVR